jgi:hypothetical protein
MWEIENVLSLDGGIFPCVVAGESMKLPYKVQGQIDVQELSGSVIEIFLQSRESDRMQNLKLMTSQCLSGL